MGKHSDEMFSPAQVFTKLRQIVAMLVLSVVLLVASGVILNVYQAHHTDLVFGKVDDLLSRGDCRSANLSDYLVNLADVLQEAIKSNADESVISKDAQALATAAKAYSDCAKAGATNTTTTTKGTP